MRSNKRHYSRYSQGKRAEQNMKYTRDMLRNFTKDEIADMKQLRRLRWPFARIADKYGTAIQTIKDQLGKIGGDYYERGDCLIRAAHFDKWDFRGQDICV